MAIETTSTTGTDGVPAIRERLAAATDEHPGPWTVTTWPPQEHPYGAEAEVRAGESVVLVLTGSAAWVALGGHAAADLKRLLDERAALLEVVSQQDRAICALQDGRDAGPALEGVARARVAAGFAA